MMISEPLQDRLIEASRAVASGWNETRGHISARDHLRQTLPPLIAVLEEIENEKTGESPEKTLDAQEIRRLAEQACSIQKKLDLLSTPSDVCSVTLYDREGVTRIIDVPSQAAQPVYDALKAVLTAQLTNVQAELRQAVSESSIKSDHSDVH